MYAIDLPGFGRSSKYKFSKNPKEIESEYVEFIEQWRKELNLEKMVICGHSFGAYLATAYALKYPMHMSGLILDDPWVIVLSNKNLSANLIIL